MRPSSRLRGETAVMLTLLFGGFAGSAPADGPDNPAIDMAGYLRLALQAADHRASRRLTEEEFLRRSREPGVIVLDARSRDKYDELHVRGALSLPFTDLTVESLARLLPDRRATVLIYCNNNFANAPEPFPTKLPTASLNLSTYIALFTYGYENVYELGPLVDLAESKLEFAGSLAQTETPLGGMEAGLP
ncbi:MAG: rhodanese-like domain-containing protein [Thermoanaerobaculia bacterium]